MPAALLFTASAFTSASALGILPGAPVGAAEGPAPPMVPGMAGAVWAAAKPEAAIRAAIRMESVDWFISGSLKLEG
jgi:hypothetical protein